MGFRMQNLRSNSYLADYWPENIGEKLQILGEPFKSLGPFRSIAKITVSADVNLALLTCDGIVENKRQINSLLKFLRTFTEHLELLLCLNTVEDKVYAEVR